MLAPLLISALLLASDRPTSPLADIGPAPRTVLVDSAGKPFDLASLKGKVVLVSFVYTTCTGVCPGTTQAIVRVRTALEEAKLWGTRSRSSRSRSTRSATRPTSCAGMPGSSGPTIPAWHFLTGPPRQVQSVIADWGMWVKALPDRWRSTIPRGSSSSIPADTSARSTTSSS